MANQPESDRDAALRHHCVLIEAFLDGERVDPRTLKEALAEPEARDHFVDVLLMREAVDAIAPSASDLRSPSSRATPSRAKWLTAAAAMTLVSLTVGYAAGQRVVAPAADPSTVEAVLLPVEPAALAPEPTRSIAFTPGVNWTESPEGR